MYHLLEILGGRTELNSAYLYVNSTLYDRVSITPDGKITLASLDKFYYWAFGKEADGKVYEENLLSPVKISQEEFDAIRDELVGQVMERMLGPLNLTKDERVKLFRTLAPIIGAL